MYLEIDFANKLKVEPYSPLGAGNNYEMGSMNDAAPPGYSGDSQQEFFAEVNELRDGIDTVKANISRIESLHQRSLTDIDESTSSQTQHQLDALVAETSALNKNLANRIKRLKSKAASDPAKGPQVGNLDRNFKDTLRKYQTVEAAYSKRAKEQMARQYRIVKPDASEQEVEEACSDTQGAQIFSQAVRFCLKAYLENASAFKLTFYSSSAVIAVAKPDPPSARSRPDTTKSSASKRPSSNLPTFSTKWNRW